MDPQLMVFMLLFAGVSLIFAEFFLPSGGVIALTCVACFAGSIYYAHDAWSESNPSYWWGYLGSVTLIIPLAIMGGFYLLNNTPLGNRILLKPPTQEEVTPYQAEVQRLQKFIGLRGRALGSMSPGGIVRVNGERLHAICETLMVEPDTEVEVVNVRGTRVIVRPVVESETLDMKTDDMLADDETNATEDDAPDDPWLKGNV